MQVRRGLIALAVVGSMGAGALGAWLFAPGAGGAATTSTTPAAVSGRYGTLHSNEDPAHEAQESPQREADENAGHLGHRDGAFHANEDRAHEKSESAQREAQENSGQWPAP